MHIGKSSVPLCIEALKAAVKEAKAGSDVARYKEAWDAIRVAAPDDPDASRDEEWIDQTTRANKSESNRLENELKGYKNNLVKESIRVGSHVIIFPENAMADLLCRWETKILASTIKK
jgi:COP9 signalosome complex subunit 1